MAESALERLLDSLLYEGYALYPYTPGATKNSTPTPFGIVYPPSYAAGSSSTFDHLELRCVLSASPEAELRAEVRFLAATGERHAGEACRLALPPRSLRELAEAPLQSWSLQPSGAGGRLAVELELSVEAIGHRLWETSLRVENRTPCSAGLDRAGALSRSLLSTHPLLRVSNGTFLSPLERDCASVNTFPVLATPIDDAVLGAAIVLPDHPQIAPESRGGMFDSTEIEEALLLHVQTLSDAERDEIERQDPAVREMVARAAAATPQDIAALHGRVTIGDRVQERPAFTASPPVEPAGLRDPRAGEEQQEVDGVVFRKGGRVRICPGPDADLHARMLDGRTATIDTILVDYDGKTHLGVTIDDDPGQELLRESGRYLFFFAPEVEVIE
jgi:hypothetical protein